MTNRTDTATTDDLRALVDRGGPYLSVALTTGPADESAREETLLRWRALRDDAEVQGAPEDVLRMVDDRVESVASHRTGHLLVATATDLLVDEPSTVTPLRDTVRWGPLPALAPILASRQYLVPHLVVLVDRLGADIGVIDRDRSELVVEEGEDNPIRKVAGGGWSQRRFQQRAEETWERNAAAVAEDLDRLADEVDPMFVLLGGDVRAVELVTAKVAAPVAERIVPTGATRAADGSVEQLDADRVAALDTSARVLDEELLARLEEGHGRGEGAVVGAAAVLEALRAAEIGTLALHPRPDEASGWFATLPQVAEEPGVLLELGLEPAEAPLEDVATAAALATGAEIRVLGAPPLGADLAATRRW